MVDTLGAARLTAGDLHAIQRQRVVLLAILGLLSSLGLAGLTLVAPFGGVALLLGVVVLAAIVWRPLVGVYVLFGLMFLFEAGGVDPLMLPGAYLHSGIGSSTGLAGVIVSPLELLLLFTLAVWLARAAIGRRPTLRGGRLGWPLALFLVALLLGLARGSAGGGDLNIALWEARALFYIVICYVLAANTVRTVDHVRALTAIALVTMGLFAIEGVYRRVALLDTKQIVVIPEFAYSHEDVIFLGALLLLVIAQQVFGAPLWQRLVGPPLALAAGYTLLATERRAGYIAVLVAFLALALVFLRCERRAFFLFAVPVLIGGAIYLPLFWNDTSLLGQPARAIRSLSEPDPRDASSNEYRMLEKINVRATIQSDPLLGVGFGRPFLFVVPMPDLSWWPFWRYEPHHNVLWVWLKTGAGGFIAFWILIGTAVALAARDVRTLVDPPRRVFALFALVTIISTLVFCYVDLGLTMGRVTVVLGTLLGTLAVLDRLEGKEAAQQGEDHYEHLRRDLHAQPAGSHRPRGRQRAGQRLSGLRPAGR